MYMHVDKSVFCVKGGHREGRGGGPRSAVFRSPSLRGAGGWGVRGHVGPVCGNPALLTSHTLFSRSCKPLMPQKMLGLLWPGTAEEGGQRGGGRAREEGSRPGRERDGSPSPSVAALAPCPPLLSRPVISSLLSTPLSSSLLTQLCHLDPLKRIWPGRI